MTQICNCFFYYYIPAHIRKPLEIDMKISIFIQGVLFVIVFFFSNESESKKGWIFLMSLNCWKSWKGLDIWFYNPLDGYFQYHLFADFSFFKFQVYLWNIDISDISDLVLNKQIGHFTHSLQIQYETNDKRNQMSKFSQHVQHLNSSQI